MEQHVAQRVGADSGQTTSQLSVNFEDLDAELVAEFGADAQYVLCEDALNDFRDQQFRSEWRVDSATEREYYDGNQLDADLIRKWKARGIPIMVVNRIRKAINGIVGHQERNLTDFVVRTEGVESTELSDALSAAMKVAERETRTDAACLDAFAGSVKGGIDWVEVSPETDPFKFHVRVKGVKWREMYWDEDGSSEPDGSDGRFMRRLRFLPRKTLMRYFPSQREIIRHAGTSSDHLNWYEPEQLERGDNSYRDYPSWQHHWQRGDELCLEEVWYKVEVSGMVCRLPSGVVIEWDPRNPKHVAAAQRGLVKPEPAMFRKVRQAYWLGPHRLLDRWSPLPHNEYPYVPFICYREDSTGKPYGAIRDLRYLQDEINVRRAKMGWGLDATRTFAEKSAVENHASTAEEIGRKDAYVVTADSAVSGGRIKVDEHQGLNRQQYEIYKDAEATIQDVGGTPDPFLGEQDSAGQSGKALQTRIDQTLTMLGTVNRNYRQSREKVGQLLMAHVVAKMGTNHAIPYEDPIDGSPRRVVVNEEVVDSETGQRYLNNNLQHIRLRAVLDETPSTPTYRIQQFESIMRALTGAPDDVQIVLWPSALELSEIPNRKQAVKALKKRLGMSEPETPEEIEAAKVEAAKRQRAEEAQLRGAEAKADRDAAQAQAVVMKATPDAQLVMAKVDELITKVAQMQQDMAAQAAALAANGGVPDKQEAQYRW
jgi:hypothetical protein